MQKLKVYLALTLLGIFAFPVQVSAAQFDNKTVGQVLVDGRPCVFFWLVGVPQSDPSVSGSWFAISRSSSNSDVEVSMLLSAKLTGKPLAVMTDGTTSCGWATVTGIMYD